MQSARKDRVAIVTGSSTGIGLETARGLARERFEVVLAVRDEARGEAARTEILRTEPDARLHVMRVDLASQGSIRSFVSSFDERFERLDVLVNNAALVPAKRTVTEDGIETQFGVNHLGPYLLTTLLLPKLKASAPSRVVVVSSSVHKGQRLDFEDLMMESSYSQLRAYSRSKLANLLFMRALSRRLEGSGVTVNAVHPGVVATELARDMPAPFRFIARAFFAAPAKGARTSLFVATSPKLHLVSGRYFANEREQPLGPEARDDAAAERLWEVSAKLAARATAPSR